MESKHCLFILLLHQGLASVVDVDTHKIIRFAGWENVAQGYLDDAMRDYVWAMKQA